MFCSSNILARPAEWMGIPVTGMKKKRKIRGILEEGLSLTPPTCIPAHLVMSPNCATVYEKQKCGVSANHVCCGMEREYYSLQRRDR